jgi:hypothetical protein
MFDPPGSRLSPAEFSRRLDEAKALAAVLRRQALRELGSSVFAAAASACRRLVHADRATRPPAGRAANATT